MAPLAKACISVGTGLFLLFIAGLSGYAFTKVSGDATFGREGVVQHEVRIKHLEDAHVEILSGQRAIIKLLFIRPGDRKPSDLEQD